MNCLAILPTYRSFLPELKNLRVESKRSSYGQPKEGSFSLFVLIKESKKLSTNRSILKVVSLSNRYQQIKNIFSYVTSTTTMQEEREIIFYRNLTCFQFIHQQLGIFTRSGRASVSAPNKNSTIYISYQLKGRDFYLQYLVTTLGSINYQQQGRLLLTIELIVLSDYYERFVQQLSKHMMTMGTTIWRTEVPVDVSAMSHCNEILITAIKAFKIAG